MYIFSSEAIRHNDEIENNLKTYQEIDADIKKLLLLGAGESGKSTLFKQAVNLYGKGHTIEQKREYLPVIHNTIINSLKLLIAAAGDPKISIITISETNCENCEIIKACDDKIYFSAEIADACTSLWGDLGIRAAYDNRFKFSLPESAKYFLDRIEDIKAPNYTPSVQDLLHCRVLTSGISETSFKIQNASFTMLDVGGQRNERKKWIHIFNKVTAVLFVVALSEYDLVLSEDQLTNRMDESLKLFAEICNSRWFRDSDMILFLNKRDLFAEKVKSTSIRVCPSLAEYKGTNNYNESIEYIRNIFISKNESSDYPIYVHVTCATDTNDMKVVFGIVKDTVIENALKYGELI